MWASALSEDCSLVASMSAEYWASWRRHANEQSRVTGVFPKAEVMGRAVRRLKEEEDLRDQSSNPPLKPSKASTGCKKKGGGGGLTV